MLLILVLQLSGASYGGSLPGYGSNPGSAEAVKNRKFRAAKSKHH